MTIEKRLRCDRCGKTAKYSSADIIYDHLICQYCGSKIMVVKNLDEINVDYINIKGTIMRRDPKVKMRKKDRRRMRDEGK